MDAPEETLVNGNQRTEGHSFYQIRGLQQDGTINPARTFVMGGIENGIP